MPVLADLAIRYRAPSELIPYAANSRTHSDEQIEQIRASIREFGFTNPILLDGASGIIAGHGRLLAAQAEGLEEIPTIELAHLTEDQKRALVIADNQIAVNAGWDRDMLRSEIEALMSGGFDETLLGFDSKSLAAILQPPPGAGLIDEDETPDVPEVPISAAGDLWMLGPHRLACGSSTDMTVVEAAIGGGVPMLMVTDPPYGVEYDPSWRAKAGVGGTKRTGKVLNDDRADWREAWALFPGDVAYVWHGALHTATVAEGLEAEGFAIRAQIIWEKDRLVLGRGDYHWQHEPCLYAVRKRGKGHWSGDRKQTTVWKIANRDQDAETVHGTQKPVECMRRPMLNNSSEGQAIYEPFMGSGTTLIAAETCGRVCFGVELNPAYVDVAVARWQAFTGRAAVLDGDGRSFAEIAAVRAGEAA